MDKFCKLGQAVIDTEIIAIQALRERIDHNFSQACQYLFNCKGRIIVIGMGKSGHIGNKIAATLASTGSPAFFVHPAEASHGDFGMITQQDVILALSNSGETSEITIILPLIKRMHVPLISMTGNPQSTLARTANINLDVSVEKEACPLGLAPTSSTTACLVMGDALAVALLEARGFTAEDFARAHPGGRLGRRLLLRVSDIMRTGDALPKIADHVPLPEALVEITNKRLGMTCIVDMQGKLAGIYTDGDLRRTLDKNLDIHKTYIKDVMTRSCKTIAADTLAVDALQLMEQHKVTSLVIINAAHEPFGVVHLHDLLQAGI